MYLVWCKRTFILIKYWSDKKPMTGKRLHAISGTLIAGVNVLAIFKTLIPYNLCIMTGKRTYPISGFSNCTPMIDSGIYVIIHSMKSTMFDVQPCNIFNLGLTTVCVFMVICISDPRKTVILDFRDLDSWNKYACYFQLVENIHIFTK
jgi:hypothetical protein